MNKKILISLSVITVVAVIAIGGTIAYFSDTETSVGNTFTAGALDIEVDNTCHYDGMICSLNNDVAYVWTEESNGSSTYPELIGKPCDCTWVQKDLDGELFFNFNDIKPGDNGENTISLHATANDAYVCIEVDNLTNKENGCTEPEEIVDGTCATPGIGVGELQDYIHLKIWRDNGVNATGGEAGVACDNVWQAGEPVLVEDTVINDNSGSWALYSPQLGALKSGATECIGVAWSLPGSVENIVQGDSVSADISFYAEQARNNANFTCERVSKVFVLDEQNSPGQGDNQSGQMVPPRNTYEQPYVTWKINGDEIEFTFNNPTPWLFVFDVRVDEESGVNRDQTGTDLTNLTIGAGPLSAQQWGKTYQRVVVDGREDGTPVHQVTQTFTGTNKIEVGLREGAERNIYFDWIRFIAQVAP